MFDRLRSYLVQATTPEHVAVFERATRLFDAFQLDGYEFHYEQILATADSGITEPNNALPDTESLTRKYLFEIIESHSVLVDEETKTDRLCDIAEGLFALQDHEAVETIIEVCRSSTEADPIEALAELLALTNEVTSEEYLLDLTFVNSLLIQRLLETYSARLGSAESEINLNTQRQLLNRLERFLGFLKVPEIRVSSLVRAGLSVGLSMREYCQMYQSLFEQLPVNNTAVELYAFALISSEQETNPLTLIDTHMELVLTDTDRAVQVRKVASNIIKQFSAYEQELSLTKAEP